MILKVCMIVLLIVYYKYIQTKPSIKWFHFLLMASVYVLLVYCITIIGRVPGSVSKIIVNPIPKYYQMFTNNWNGEGKYIAREIIGNVVLFAPLGQILSILFRGKCLPMIVILGFAASLAIEATQYRYGLGTFEVSDLIHNTIGAVCGYYIYKANIHLKRKNFFQE